MSIGQSVVHINPKRQLFAAEAAARLLDAKRTADLPLFRGVSASAESLVPSADGLSTQPLRVRAR